MFNVLILFLDEGGNFVWKLTVASMHFTGWPWRAISLCQGCTRADGRCLKRGTLELLLLLLKFNRVIVTFPILFRVIVELTLAATFALKLEYVFET